MFERTKVEECRADLIHVIAAFVAFLAGFIGTFVIIMQEQSMTGAVFQETLAVAVAVGTVISLLVALFTYLAVVESMNVLGAFVLTGIVSLLILLVLDFVLGIISKVGISKDALSLLCCILYVVMLAVGMMRRIKAYKAAVEQEKKGE